MAPKEILFVSQQADVDKFFALRTYGKVQIRTQCVRQIIIENFYLDTLP